MLLANDPVMNLVDSIDSTSALEEGTTFIFGSWVCKEDGTGGFSSHLIEPMQPKVAAMNYVMHADGMANDFHEPQLSNLIRQYFDNFSSIQPRRIDNSDRTKGIDHVSGIIVECI